MSGPLLDRIDLRVEVPAVAWDDLVGDRPGEPSAVVRERVVLARKRARRRGMKGLPRTNAELPVAALEEVCALDRAGRRLLETAVGRLGLSARGYHRTLRIARTIADLAGEGRVREDAVAEAIRYRGAELVPSWN